MTCIEPDFDDPEVQIGSQLHTLRSVASYLHAEADGPFAREIDIDKISIVIMLLYDTRAKLRERASGYRGNGELVAYVAAQ